MGNKREREGSWVLKKMRYVYTVYEEQSFSRAAEKLFISQPSLSAMVKKVECDYGITIFDRTTTPVSLTPEGEYYIRTAKRMLELEDAMRQHFRECSRGLSGSVTFGGSSFFCASMLSGLIRQFQREYPEIHIGWKELRNDELVGQMLQKKIDFAFEVDRIEVNGIASMKFGSEEVILAVPASYAINETLRDFCFRPGREDNGIHGIHDAKSVDLSAFRELPFVFQREGNDSHARGMQLCANAGFTPRIAMQVDTSMTGYHLAAAGNGAFFVRDSVLAMEASDRLCYYKIDDSLNQRDIFLYYRADGRSRVEDTLLSFVRGMVGGA